MTQKLNDNFNPTIFGKFTIKKENDGKRVIIIIDRNNIMSDYAFSKFEELFANKNVCIEVTPLLQYMKFQRMLDEDENKQQRKLV